MTYFCVNGKEDKKRKSEITVRKRKIKLKECPFHANNNKALKKLLWGDGLSNTVSF